MAGETFEKIASVSVGAGGSATIGFTSIPQTFTDLVVYLSGRNTAANNSGNLTLNGSSASFTNRSIWGDGNNDGSSSFTGGP